MEINVGGRRVRIATGGTTPDPANPLVVLLHSAAADRTAWALVARAIAADGWSVCAPDLPGHGASDGPAPDSVEEAARWVVELVAAMGHTSAHLAGHSLGSLVALETAATRPDLARSLTLLGSAARMPVHPDLQAAADAGQHLAIELIASWGLGRTAQLGRHPSPGLVMREASLRMMERTAPEVVAIDLRASAAYERATIAAADVRCPTLVIVGGDDRMTPARNLAPLLASLRDPVVVRLPGAGHSLMAERPHEVIDAILSHLDSTEERR